MYRRRSVRVHRSQVAERGQRDFDEFYASSVIGCSLCELDDRN
jgi:hypothetical protein